MWGAFLLRLLRRLAFVCLRPGIDSGCETGRPLRGQVSVFKQNAVRGAICIESKQNGVKTGCQIGIGRISGNAEGIRLAHASDAMQIPAPSWRRSGF
jgi:hypothetical protein